MLTLKYTFRFSDKFLTERRFVMVDCLSSIGVCCRNSHRNISLRQCNRLNSSSSHLLSSYSRVNSNYILNRQQNKYNSRSKLIISNNVINEVSSFSNSNVYRYFSISSVYFNDKNTNLDKAVAAGESSVSSSSISAVPVNSKNSLLSEFDGNENGAELLEPSFSSLGLGGWTPAGLVQSGMEYLHITCGLPWWACIICGTVLIRSAVLPLVIRFQKNILVMSNAMPQIQLLQMKMTNARESGNIIDAARYNNELFKLLQNKKINPLKSAALPLIQMPFFLSFFFGLRGMAELPVESLREGGLWWFSDLTVCDPYYILPVATCVTLFITIELGLEAGMSPNQMPIQFVKYFLRATPFIMFPIIINFPGVILLYWLSTNIYSLVQSNVMRIPSVRNFLGFEVPVNNTESLKLLQKMQSMPNKGFREGFRESMSNMKVSQEIMERNSLELQERLNKMKADLRKKNLEK